MKCLELTLWDRSKRTAVLTPEGEFFYKEALKISRQYHRSLEAVYHFKDSKLQALHIGTLPFLSQYHLKCFFVKKLSYRSKHSSTLAAVP